LFAVVLKSAGGCELMGCCLCCCVFVPDVWERRGVLKKDE